MKKICIFLLFCVIFAAAELINGVAIIVNNEPITLYEINKTAKELKIDKQKAVELLINDRIEQAQIKKMGNAVSDFELENEIKKMLTANESDLASLKAELNAKGQSYEDFKKEYKKQLEKRKLYEAVASGAKVDYSEEGAQAYYELHSDEFMLYESISVNSYNAQSSELLENFRANKAKIKGIKQNSELLTLQNTDPRLVVFLSSIAVGEFSPVLEDDEGFVLYEIKGKNRPQKLPYSEIKEQVQSIYTNKQRQDFIKDFFDKEHSKANIVYLR